MQCPVCGSGNFTRIPYPGRIPRNERLAFENIALCSECATGVAEPRVAQSDLDRFYASGAYWHLSGSNGDQVAHESSQSKLRAGYCLPYLTAPAGLRVLDVGAGHGFIADWLESAARGKVQNYDFIEPDDATAAGIARRPRAFAVKRLSSMVLAEAEAPYDLVFVNHVLEHVADPVEFMARLISFMKRDGVAYVETPHSDYRYKDDVFPHTLFFTERSFARLADRLGVRQLECSAFGAWPGSRQGISQPAFRLLSIALRVSVMMRLRFIQRMIDRAIWRYGSHADGIWLRWVFRRGE